VSIRIERAGPGDPKLGVRVDWDEPSAADVPLRRRGWVIRLAASVAAGLIVAGLLTARVGTARPHALAGQGGVAAALASGFTVTFITMTGLTFAVLTVVAWRRRTRMPRAEASR
jgi:hypothetical protein